MTQQERGEFLEALLARIHELLKHHEVGHKRDLHVFFGRRDPATGRIKYPDIRVQAYDTYS